MAYQPKNRLDPRVVAMLPDIYTASQLEYAKGVVSGEIKPTYFKASDIPERKPVPEAFKKKANAKTKTKAKQKRTRRIVSEFSHEDMTGAINHGVIAGDSRQQVIQSLVDRFRVSKHSAGYHYDKFVGKR
jgi:hypothetical protein